MRVDADIETLMKHAHALSRRGRGADSELTYTAASEIARLRQEFRWQPTATAPKDGTRILALLHFGDKSEHEAAIIYWSGRPNFPWKIPDNDGVAEHVVRWWMPLPAAPEDGPATASSDLEADGVKRG